MSGHRGHMGSKPAREIFLTSSSLSFSSLSSSISWDDAIELNMNESKTSYKDKSQQNGESSEMSGVTHVRMKPALSPPSKSQPVPLMNKGFGNYNPERISASVLAKTGDRNWSEISNDSLFSLKVDGYRKSNAQASRQSNIKFEEVLMSGEFLRYTPSLLVKPGDAKEKIPEVKEIKIGETRVDQSHIHQEKSTAIPDVSCSTNPNNSYGLDQAPPTKVQSCSLPVGDKKSKKINKTRKSKKKNKKKEIKEKNNKEKKKKNNKKNKNKNKNKCCMWSWLCSVFSKCECNLRCYKWRKCCCCYCRGPKTKVL